MLTRTTKTMVTRIAPSGARLAVAASQSQLFCGFSTNKFQKAEDKSPYAHGKFRSNAEQVISKIPVIEVDDHIAVCDGGSGALGHPLEYIQLDTVSSEPAVCKYCGLRYKHKHTGHH